MSARLSLPRLSLREHFAAFVHEVRHPYQPVLTFQAGFSAAAAAYDAPIPLPVGHSLFDKGKARAIDTARDVSLPGPSRSRDQPPSRPSPSRPPPPRGGPSNQSARPRPRHPESFKWRYGQGINANTQPSAMLEPRLAAARSEVLESIHHGDMDSALRTLTNIYASLENQGSLRPLRGSGNALDLSTMTRLGKTTDHLLFLRDLLASVFDSLRTAFTQTTGDSWNSRKRERLQIQSAITSFLLWFFERPPIASLISFHNPRLAIASRLCIMALDAPHHRAKKIAKILVDRDRHDAVPAVYQVFILALVTSSQANLAFELYKEATERQVPVREVVGRKLARVLSVEQRFDLADQAFEMILQQGEAQDGSEFTIETQTLESRVCHQARAGRVDEVQSDLDLLAERPGTEIWIGKSRSHLLAEALAVHGDIEQCDAVLAEMFDLDWRPGVYVAEGKRAPSRVANSLRIQARISARRLWEAEELLDHMLRIGQIASLRAFEDLMAACSKTEDVLFARRILESHQKLGYALNAPLLGSLMHIYARRQDAEGAHRVLGFMMELGLRVPASAFNTLLLAHVEASDWKAAFHLFRRMERTKQVGRRPNRRSYEIMLKALVMSGASVKEVFRFAEIMKENGAEYDARTYALLIQSASDAGTMGLALEMFDTADETLEGGADEFHFSIIINGLLREGSGYRAKKYFDLMQTRGLQPSHVTYAMLVQQHARMGTDEDLEKAVRVATWALSELEVVPGGKGNLHQANLSAMLYMPILRAEVDRGNSVAAEETLGDMGEASGLTAIRSLTILLDLYRRDGRVQAAMEAWYQLLALACAEQWTTLLQVLTSRVRLQLNNDGTPRVEEQRLRHPSSLCIPLSIIMDALSTAGLYDEAVQAWKVVRDLGGHFDPDNWNVLMAVHAGAGRLEEALEILEHVLRETPPNWEWLREQARVGDFVPHPVESINLLEGVMGPKGLVGLKSRRHEKRLFEDADESLTGRRSDVDQEGEDGEVDEGVEGREKTSASLSDARSESDGRKRGQSSPAYDDEEDRELDASDEVEERDTVSVALARRTTIDSCFWFAHEKKLTVLMDALSRQEAHSDLRRSGWRSDVEDGYGQVEASVRERERPQGRFLSQAEIRQRYPNATRIMSRFGRRQQGPPQRDIRT
ncbi:unnamed protein product [Tilletia laevis]|uniref:Pentatricopeptide repeat-containing protein-mitochondrial domain-containing protein n=2 Tax=Tilletia TaxID=13289 RepID=A0A177V5B0_9BASI|nr:hypothetical protein CF336_g6240 [Tilletia laevis]KAE8254593.1 hypothetical protein A4X03_0g5694 [Tilletia caries]CAD6907517.1 unnamed protein product [Tilletia controversa]KAE8193062.1 hypothetical protein CF335_g5691 [Tilletia laevis]CAD6892568.1 unnamed protein product [Tilletia caries]